MAIEKFIPAGNGIDILAVERLHLMQNLLTGGLERAAQSFIHGTRAEAEVNSAVRLDRTAHAFEGLVILDRADRFPPQVIPPAKNVFQLQRVLFLMRAIRGSIKVALILGKYRRHRFAQRFIDGRSLSKVGNLSRTADIRHGGKEGILNHRTQQNIRAPG